MTRGASAKVFVPLLGAAAAALVWAEWHTDEVTVVLALLLALAAVLGIVRPAAALATGLVLGGAIAVAHGMSELGWLPRPAYQLAPPSPGDWLAMSLLVLPGLAAAYAAVLVRAAAGGGRRGIGEGEPGAPR